MLPGDGAGELLFIPGCGGVFIGAIRGVSERDPQLADFTSTVDVMLLFIFIPRGWANVVKKSKPTTDPKHHLSQGVYTPYFGMITAYVPP